jgi:hypothetical protein
MEAVVTAHPAALVLDDHQPVYVTAATPPTAMVRCSCNATVQWCDFATHQTEALVEAGLLAGGTGDRFTEFSVHGDGNSDAWLWHEPCRTELDAIDDPWTLVELVASARSHLSGCGGAT